MSVLNRAQFGRSDDPVWGSGIPSRSGDYRVRLDDLVQDPAAVAGDVGDQGWSVDQLAESMELKGQEWSIDFDPLTMSVLNGNHRVEAARRLGWDHVVGEPAAEQDIDR